MIKPNPKAPVYTLPRTFLSTQRSDIYPPTNTPNSDDKAMEIVDIGPATEISIDKLSEKRVGNQFLPPIRSARHTKVKQDNPEKDIRKQHSQALPEPVSSSPFPA